MNRSKRKLRKASLPITRAPSKPEKLGLRRRPLESAMHRFVRALRATGSARVGTVLSLILNILNLVLLLPILAAICHSLWVPEHLRLATLVLAPMMGASMFQAIHAWGGGKTPSAGKAQRLTLLAAALSVALLGLHEFMRNTCVVTLPAEVNEEVGRAVFRPLWLSDEVQRRAAEAGGVYALASDPATSEWFRVHATADAPWAATVTAALFTASVAGVAMAISAAAGFARLALTLSAFERLRTRSRTPAPAQEAHMNARQRARARRARLKMARVALAARYLRGNVALGVVLAAVNMAVFADRATGLFRNLWLPEHVKEPALVLVPLIGVVVFQFIYSLHLAQLLSPFVKHLLVIGAATSAIVLLLSHHYLYTRCIVETKDHGQIYVSLFPPPSVRERVENTGSLAEAVQQDPYWIEDQCRYESPSRITLTSFLFALSFGGLVACLAAAAAFAGELFLEYSIHARTTIGVPAAELPMRVGERAIAQGIEAVTEAEHQTPSHPTPSKSPQPPSHS